MVPAFFLVASPVARQADAVRTGVAMDLPFIAQHS